MSEALSVDLPLSGALRLFSDERLMGRAMTGDQRAFAAIYRRYHRELYRFTLAIVGDAEDAAEVLQSTMVKAMRALPGEPREIQLKPWLYRVVHNESVELLRRRRAAVELSAELPAVTAQPHEEAERRQRLRTLFRDLAELPDRQRAALLMRELSGLSFGEIADALGASLGVARQTTYEARLSLRQMEEGRGLECESVTRALSVEDGRVSRRRDLRAHLRECPGCRDFQQAIGGRRDDLAEIGSLPAVAAAGILEGVLGAEAVGGSLAGGIGAAAAVKSAATVAVVAVLGASVADQAGLVGLGRPGSDDVAASAVPRVPVQRDAAAGGPAALPAGRGDGAGAPGADANEVAPAPSEGSGGAATPASGQTGAGAGAGAPALQPGGSVGGGSASGQSGGPAAAAPSPVEAGTQAGSGGHGGGDLPGQAGGNPPEHAGGPPEHAGGPPVAAATPSSQPGPPASSQGLGPTRQGAIPGLP